MMYGTRKELNKKLKRMFGNNDHFALLVWTKQDVMAQVENMTESEAAAILQEIGSVTGHTEEGIFISHGPGDVCRITGRHPDRHRSR